MNSSLSAEIKSLCEILSRTSETLPCIALAGSLAKGNSDEHSDIDLFLFTDSPKTFEERTNIIKEICDPGTFPWISESLDYPWGGSMDFMYHGKPVEVVVRLFSFMEKEVERAIHGEFDIIPQSWTSNGYYTYIYLSELNFIAPLQDPSNRLANLKEKGKKYPQALKESIIRCFWQSSGTWPDNFHYQSAIRRRDVLFTSPIVLHTLLDDIQIIFALNETFYPGDKKLEQNLASLQYCPKDFLPNLDMLLTAQHDTALLQNQLELLRKIRSDLAEEIKRQHLDVIL